MKNREAMISSTRAVVASETRAQRLAGTLDDLRSEYATLSCEDELKEAALTEAQEENERLSSEIEDLKLDLAKAESKRASLAVAFEAAQETSRVASQAWERDLRALESKLAAAEDKIAKQQVALHTSTERNGRIQNDLAGVEVERRQEQEAHAREKESWQLERVQMRAVLDAIRTEQARPLVTPALMDAFLGVHDMARLATS